MRRMNRALETQLTVHLRSRRGYQLIRIIFTRGWVHSSFLCWSLEVSWKVSNLMFWLFEVSLKSVVKSLAFGSPVLCDLWFGIRRFLWRVINCGCFIRPIRATQIFNHTTASFENLVYTHLRQNWVKFVLITEKFQFPVNSWPRQVRPTCLCADKNLSTETNLQRSRGPATNQDLIGTTNKKCFSWDKVVDRISLFRCDWVVQSAYTGMNSGFRSNVPVFGRSDTDNSYDQHNGYRPGQYFWSRYQNHDAQLQQFPQTLLCQRRVWLDLSILAIQSSYRPAPAVCQLNRPHLQHHQSPLMLRF